MVIGHQFKHAWRGRLCGVALCTLTSVWEGCLKAVRFLVVAWYVLFKYAQVSYTLGCCLKYVCSCGSMCSSSTCGYNYALGCCLECVMLLWRTDMRG